MTVKEMIIELSKFELDLPVYMPWVEDILEAGNLKQVELINNTKYSALFVRKNKFFIGSEETTFQAVFINYLP